MFVAFGMAATGGPLALGALYFPQAVAAWPAAGITAVTGGALFACPVMVWYRYSSEIASHGGLFAFVEAAAGRRVALAHAVAWILSYVLYLPFTVAYIVYDLLPAVVPSLADVRPLLDVLLPVAIASLAALRLRAALRVVAIVALGQIAILAAFATIGGVHTGARHTMFVPSGPVVPMARGMLNISLLFICASLPLYLGGEVVGGARTVQRGLLCVYGLSTVLLVAGTVPWAAAVPTFGRFPIPGESLARAAWTPVFGTIVGVGVLASIGGVVVAEYFALPRLLHAVTGRPLGAMTWLVAAVFIGVTPVSLINPDAFYADLLRPSLVALWVAQVPVFAFFPFFAHRRGERIVPAVLLAAVSTGLAAYGLYSAITAAVS